MNSNHDLEYAWKRQYSLFYGDAALLSLIEYISEDLNERIKVTGQGEGVWLTVYMPQGIQQKLMDLYQDEMCSDLTKTADRIQQIHRVGKEFVDFTTSLEISDSISSEELALLMERYTDIFMRYAVELWRAFYLVVASEKIIYEEVVKELGGVETEKLFSQHSYPSQKSSLFKVSEFFEQEQDMEVRKKFVRENYPWLMSVDPFSEPMTDRWLNEYLSSFVSVSHDHHELPDDLPSRAKKLISLFQQLLYVKDARDDYRREGFFHSRSLLTTVAKRLGLSLDELSLLRMEEILLLLKSFDKEKIKVTIRGRKDAYLHIYNNDQTQLFSGDDARSRFMKEEVEQDVNEFTGAIGAKGKVTGIVKVVKDMNDLAKVNEGDVLVAITTNPNYISAMQKATAFITDEGGITCHAAIVAREMNKPAIVGTKVSTKVLQDGDEVEVDANKGIVKIVK